MKPLVVLIGTFCIAVSIGKWINGTWEIIGPGNIAMCAMLFFTGMAHFIFVPGMKMMLPDFLPFKTGIVYLTGGLEFVFGLLLLFPATRNVGSIGLIVFFTALLPANIQAASRHINLEKADYSGPGPGYLWFRIPLQLFFIGWVWYFGLLCYHVIRLSCFKVILL